MTTNIWKNMSIPEGWDSKENPYLYPREHSLDDCLAIPGISCFDAEGGVTEHYPVIHVSKDVVREGRSYKRHSISTAVENAEPGFRLPSLALTCSILAAVFKKKDAEAYNNVLLQYNDRGDGRGWHVQNTLVDLGSGKIIHYPNGECIELDFKWSPKGLNLDDSLDEDALGFMRQLTGLPDIGQLAQIGTYFNASTHLAIRGDRNLKQPFLGCSSDGNLYVALGDIGPVAAARYVCCSRGL